MEKEISETDLSVDYSKTRLTAEVDCRVHHCAITNQKHTSCPCLWYTFPGKERFYF